MEKDCTCGVSVQLSYSVVPEVSIQDFQRTSRKVCREKNTNLMRDEKGRDTRTECEGRSYTYGSNDTAKSVRIRNDGDIEGENGNKLV